MIAKARRGSGNVFRDLGFTPTEAANLQLRSTLMIHLRRRLTQLGLTQSQAAKLLDVSQPRVSDLMRGKIDRFSIDMLVALLGRAGAEVRVVVRSRPAAA